MKNLTTYVELCEKKYKVNFVYQNALYPLIRMDAYVESFFGFYLVPVSIGDGHLYPRETCDWTFDDFHNHAIEYLKINLKIEINTQVGIDNFKKLSNE